MRSLVPQLVVMAVTPKHVHYRLLASSSNEVTRLEDGVSLTIDQDAGEMR